MKKAVGKLVVTFGVLLTYLMLQRIAFLAIYQHIIHATTLEWLQVLRHGLPMDNTVAGYLSVIPALAIIASIWMNYKPIRIFEKGYYLTIALILGFTTVLDITLYGYWGFRLDTTPLFYFRTSPGAALASAEWWQYPVAVIAVGGITFLLYKALTLSTKRLAPPYIERTATTVVLALLTGLLFIPIRGGVTVSTMNPSRAYFSPRRELNHAAVNPQFSLLYSALHQEDFQRQFHYADDKEIAKTVNLLEKETKGQADSLSKSHPARDYLKAEKPHIYIIIMESFSSHLMKSLGGEAIATGLDSIAGEGLLFSNIYASSFRTDRSLPAILSGFPAQPSTSIMKYMDKTEALPSIARTLIDNGYKATYYYGGDINFTNMNAYLVHSGFGKIISDKDFPLSQKASKWGAHDHLLFARALADAKSELKGGGTTPGFTVIQTSSSHEPFEVPYQSKFLPNKRLNAFAYTDHCITEFIVELKKLPEWDRTLIVMVPDHYGVWPENLEDPLARHRVPLIMTGGALQRIPSRVETIGTQTDIAATLLAMVDIRPNQPFPFSHNLLEAGRKGYAVFSDSGLGTIVTAGDTTVYDFDGKRRVRGSALGEKRIRSFYQQVYSWL